MEEYFKKLRGDFEHAYSVAQSARAKGFDPEDEVEIIPAADMAARVEGIVGPLGVADGIRALGKDMPREMVAFEIARQIIDGGYIKGNKEKLIDQAVRTGVAILTEGVLVAPTEGIAKIKIRTNPDGTDFVGVYFAGPIRSAGGTVAALSVVLADFARNRLGIGSF
ncbi:MAG: DNA polymerase II large subunit, partial [Candidatus Micrarchaeota archaeon]|nr:DNA polymerase II large subunit [Candidatus Micrarchaeota archaeon]